MYDSEPKQPTETVTTVTQQTKHYLSEEDLQVLILKHFGLPADSLAHVAVYNAGDEDYPQMVASVTVPAVTTVTKVPGAPAP